MRIPRLILVPTDLSAGSLEALQYAEEVSRLFHAEVIVFHSIESRTQDPPTSEDPAFGARKSIIHLLMEHSIVPTSLKLHIGRGPALDGILKAITQLNVDLVVMSTYGRTGVNQILTGSIAEQVVRFSPVPVLIVKPQGPDETEDPRNEQINLNLHLN